MFIDTHCHINTFSPNILKGFSLNLASLGIFIDSSINYATTVESVKLSSQLDSVYSAIGFHPFCAKEFNTDTLASYKSFISQNKKIIAIGEIGLDEKTDVEFSLQEAVLRNFLELAKETNLPIVIHNRMSNDRIMDILSDFFSSYEKIIFHCFSCEPRLLNIIVEKGAWVSFSLNVLRRQKKVLDSLSQCPLEQLLLETDSPYMKINQQSSTPMDIKILYEFVAPLRNISQEQLQTQLLVNAKKAFSL